MAIDKKIFFIYSIIFLLLSIAAFIALDKLVSDSVKEKEAENQYLNINLISNYENYSFKFRSPNFLNEIGINNDKVRLKHIIDHRLHKVDLKIYNFNYDKLDEIKSFISFGVDEAMTKLDICINNFIECEDIKLKTEIINNLFHNYSDKSIRYKYLECLIINAFKDCENGIVIGGIKEKFNPIQVNYRIVERENNTISKDKIFLITLSITVVFLMILFVLSVPLLLYLTKNRLQK